MSSLLGTNSFAQEKIHYREQVSLEVTPIGENFEEIQFSSHEGELFKIKLKEMVNFLEVARSLEDFDKRLIKGFKFAQSLVSTIVTLSTGGTAGIVAGSAIYFIPGPQKNETLERLAKNDIPYFSIDPSGYAPFELDKRDLAELIQGLQFIHQEYNRRLSVLHEKEAKINSLIEEGLINCDDQQVISTSTIEKIAPLVPSFNYKKVLNLDNKKTITFDIMMGNDLVNSSGREYSFFPTWKTLSPEVPIARVTFDKRTMAILSFDIASKDAPSLISTHISLGEILATIGTRTRSVNALKILNTKSEVSLVHKMAVTIRSCLKN